MKRRTAVFCLLLLSFAVLSGCCTFCKPKPLQCAGYPEKVCNKCGDNPVEVVLQQRLYATGLTDLVKTNIRSCLTFSIGVDIRTPIAKANLNACLERALTLEEKPRDVLIKIVDDALNNEQTLKSKEAWDRCYNEIVIGRPKVVLMDSPLEGVVYNKKTWESGGTNADEITDALKDLPILMYKETTSLLWHRDQQVLDMNPDLIIIHLSCFYSETDVRDSDNRFRSFLDYMHESHSRFLVYTRGPAKNASKETMDRWQKLLDFLHGEEWRDRLVDYQFSREHDTINFNDNDFKNTVKRLLQI